MAIQVAVCPDCDAPLLLRRVACTECGAQMPAVARRPGSAAKGGTGASTSAALPPTGGASESSGRGRPRRNPTADGTGSPQRSSKAAPTPPSRATAARAGRRQRRAETGEGARLEATTSPDAGSVLAVPPDDPPETAAGVPLPSMPEVATDTATAGAQPGASVVDDSGDRDRRRALLRDELRAASGSPARGLSIRPCHAPAHAAPGREDLPSDPIVEEPLRDPAVAAPPHAGTSQPPDPGTGSLPGAYRPPRGQEPDPNRRPSAGAAASTGSRATRVLTEPAPRAPGRSWGLSLPDDGDIAGWLLLGGSAVAVAGFVLPWAATVIGSAGEGGWFDRWGLASPPHLPVFGLVLATLLVPLATSRVPSWLRTGVPGLLLAGLLAGLVWPYLFGRLSPMPGAYLVAAGALVLAVAGLLAVRPARHAEQAPSVEGA